jgi:hypothetical protein
MFIQTPVRRISLGSTTITKVFAVFVITSTVLLPTPAILAAASGPLANSEDDPPFLEMLQAEIDEDKKNVSS